MLLAPEKEPKLKTIYKAAIAETAEKAATGKEAENAKSNFPCFSQLASGFIIAIRSNEDFFLPFAVEGFFYSPMRPIIN